MTLPEILEDWFVKGVVGSPGADPITQMAPVADDAATDAQGAGGPPRR